MAASPVRSHAQRLLKRALDTHIRKGAEYAGKDHQIQTKVQGHVMNVMFPWGIRLNNARDHNRFMLLVHIVTKLSRYANNFEKGGHSDSLLDITVYAAMLDEMDEETRAINAAAQRERKKK